jgi:hypothetical protein
VESTQYKCVGSPQVNLPSASGLSQQALYTLFHELWEGKVLAQNMHYIPISASDPRRSHYHVEFCQGVAGLYNLGKIFLSVLPPQLHTPSSQHQANGILCLDQSKLLLSITMLLPLSSEPSVKATLSRSQASPHSYLQASSQVNCYCSRSEFLI